MCIDATLLCICVFIQVRRVLLAPVDIQKLSNGLILSYVLLLLSTCWFYPCFSGLLPCLYKHNETTHNKTLYIFIGCTECSIPLVVVRLQKCNTGARYIESTALCLPYSGDIWKCLHCNMQYATIIFSFFCFPGSRNQEQCIYCIAMEWQCFVIPNNDDIWTIKTLWHFKRNKSIKSSIMKTTLFW